MSNAASRPWILAPNRVERFFIGGRELDKWQRLAEDSGFGDSTFSEELLINTNPYIGPGTPPFQGLSFAEGAGVTLREMIASDPKGFLGTSANAAFAEECSVLCKGGDSTGRLILQYHPTRAFAREHLRCAFGKTEAWYMLGFRGTKDPYCYAGFKPGVTREHFEKLVAADDVAGMLDCIHKVPFAPGDTVLVPAGMIHAMGPDTTFIEVHEPCDYTMRFERDNYGRRMEDNDLHYGLGFPALFDGLSFQTYTAEEIKTRVHSSPQPVAAGEGWALQTLLPFTACPEFSMVKLTLKGRFSLPQEGFFQELIALRGDVSLGEWMLPQGRAAFIPAATDPLTLESPDAEILWVKPGVPQSHGQTI